MWFNILASRIVFVRAIEAMSFVVNGWVLMSGGSEGMLLAEFIALMTIPNLLAVAVVGRITDKNDAMKLLAIADVLLVVLVGMFLLSLHFEFFAVTTNILIFTFCLMSLIQVTNVSGRAVYRQYFKNNDVITRETYKYTSSSFSGAIIGIAAAYFVYSYFGILGTATFSVLLATAALVSSLICLRTKPGQRLAQTVEAKTKAATIKAFKQSLPAVMGFATFIAALPLVYSLLLVVSHEQFGSIDSLVMLDIIFSAGVIVGSLYSRKRRLSHNFAYPGITAFFIALILLSFDLPLFVSYLAVFIVGLTFSVQNIFLITVQENTQADKVGSVIAGAIVIGTVVGVLSGHLVEFFTELPVASLSFVALMSALLIAVNMLDKRKLKEVHRAAV